MLKNIVQKITKNKYYLIGAISILLLLVITLGTAALRSTLSILGTTRIKENSWVIYFDHVHDEQFNDNVDAEKHAIIVDQKKTRIEFTVDLQPGEVYEYTVDVINDGSINAMIDNVSKIELSEAQKKYLDFEVYYTSGEDAGKEPSRCDRLDAGTSREIKVSVRYKKGLDKDEYPTDDVHLNLFLEITYDQEFNCEKEHESPYSLIIDPNGGVLHLPGQDRTDAITYNLLQDSDYYSSSITLPTVEYEGKNFVQWVVEYPESGTYVLTDTTFTIGEENVKLVAQWKDGDYVARIQRTYFETIQKAFDAADGSWTSDGKSYNVNWNGDNTVHLLRNTEEYPTNTTTVPFVFNLEAFTVTGRITNASGSNLTLVNGRVVEKKQNEEDTLEGAVINRGIFALGVNDGVVDVENSISLKGIELGLDNTAGAFKFYDGYIEGDTAFIGDYHDCPDNYYAFINNLTVDGNQIERAYLVNTATRAVVKTVKENTKPILFYNVQSAVNYVVETKKPFPHTSATDNQYEIHAIRDFEAAYQVHVPENSRIIFDLENFRVWTGEKIINDGYFEIKSSDNNRASIKTSKLIENNGTLKVNNINAATTTDSYVIENKGALEFVNSEIHGQHVYAVTNTGTGSITFDNKTLIDSKEQYGLYNSSPNLNINDGTIYGFYNEGNGAQISGGTLKIYHWTTESWSGVNHHYVPAVTNVGTLNITGGTITENEYDTCLVNNSGNLNISGGELNSKYKTLCNNYNSSYGHTYVTGGTLTSENRTVYGGYVKVSNNASITSVNGSVVDNSDLEVDNGTVSTENGYATYYSNVTLKSGEIVTENGTAVYTGYNNSLTQTGGTVHSLDGAAVEGMNVNISAGTIAGTTYGIKNGGTVTVSGGTITSDDKAITCSSIDISGGTITSPNDAVTTTNLNITGGTVESTNYNAITVNGEGTVLDGNIHGGMYGILNNGKLIIGDDEGTISPNVPTIIGESVGVYITGTDTYFFDGILKGQVDGYVGEITRTPLGGTPIGGTEVIDGVTYQTDYIIQFEPWLEIEGVGQFNTIDGASDAIADGGTATIKVIKDVVPSFIQHFVDENHNKQITFDLNGHTLRSTQVAYNNDSNVTVIDSVGTGKITNDICNYFENDYNMTVNGVVMQSTGDKAAIRNYRHGTLTIEDANITAHKCGIQSMGHTIINDVTLNSEQDGVCLELIDTIYEHVYGSLTMNGGTITAAEDGVFINYGGGFTLNGGSVTAGRYGAKGMSTTINDGTITSQDVTIFGGGIEVNGGTVKSINNHALYADAQITVNGGYVEGTTAIAQYPWYDFYSHARYEPIDITGGKVVGKTGNGINLTGNTLTITGGEVYGEVDGVYSQSHVVMGNNEGVISQSVPLVQGKHNGLTSTETFYFYDGILKGQNVARDGQVNLVPDAAMIKDDYEFIDRVEYKTEYLESFGNWLRVGDQEFNSLYAAQSVIEDYGTVYVIKDVNINFEQSLVEGKHVTFDLNGHQVMMVKTLTTKGTNTVTDSSNAKTGLLSNVSEVEDLPAITNKGNLTITGGQYEASRNYAIENQGTMIVNDIDLNANGCIINRSYLEINGGSLSNTSTDRPTIENAWNGGNLKITGGTITSDYTEAISDSGHLEITGGTITSTVDNAIESSTYYSSKLISGGTITGFLNGITMSSNDKNDFNITGGVITGTTGSGVVSDEWRTYVTGGTLAGKVYGLSLTNGGTIGTDDGTVVIDTPVIKGDSYGLNVNQGTLNFNDGILKGVQYSIQGEITNIPAGTQEFNDEEIIDGKTYQTKYLIQEKDLVYNVQKDKRYNNLQTAFDEADNYNVLELLTNIPIYYPVTNNNEHPFTLDLKGYSISTNKPIVNNGKLTLTDSTSTVGSLKTSSSINLISNTNEMTINKINLINTSSSNYIVNNSGTLTLNNTIINGINSVTSSGTLAINNANITGSNTAVASSGSLTINQGTYKSDTTAIYSSGTGTNEIKQATVNGRIQNSRGTLEIKNTTINLDSKNQYYLPDETIENSGTIKLLQNTEVLGKGRISNSGTFYMDNITIDINSDKTNSYPYSGIYNSGTMDIDNVSYTVDNNINRNESRGITNVGNLTIHENVAIEIGTHDKNTGDTHYGIFTSDNGLTTIDGATINVHGMTNSHGIYIDNANAKTILLSGSLNVTDTKYSYGAYVSRGTFEIGQEDEIEQEEPSLVSDVDPSIVSTGDIRGIGVKKVNGNFNFYDGRITATTYAKPETTTHVQNLYEVTTYVDETTTYEFALLEFMGNNYDNTVVAMIGQHSFYTLQSAIDDENEYNEEIILMRSVEIENPINIPSGKNVVIDLHGMSLTTSINNYGTLQVYNGTIIETGVDDPETEEVEPHNFINNQGTLILGKDDGTVSSSSIRVISEGIAIENIHNDGYTEVVGRLEMYDGYIEGNPAITGEINKIADFARLYTKKDSQYERIYLQSLSREAIESGETDLILSIDPNGGTYKELVDPIQESYVDHTESFNVYLNYVYNRTYDLVPNPTKHACIFDGWEINDDSVISEITDGYRITIGLKDIEVKAKWQISPDAVAKIGNNYYLSIAEAHEAAKNGDTIEVIKDITLDDETNIVMNKELTLDLGGHTINGNISNNAVLVNNGILKIVNGQIKNDFNNETGIGVINTKTLTLGVNDGEIKYDNVYIFGKSVGLQQDGALNFYDGVIEGLVSMNGSVSAAPRGYFLYTEPNELNDPPTQRLFLSGNPENAVAIIEDGANTQYFFKLTSAIAAAHVNGKEIKIIKDFEATYPITVSEGMNIVINMFGYDISTGQEITNNGSLKIYDTDTESPGSITSAKTLINNGTLTIEDITINQSRDVDTIVTSGTLTINGAEINNTNGNQHYAINNTGTLNIIGDSTITTNVGRAILSNGGVIAPISSGSIGGIETYDDLTIEDGAYIYANNNYEAIYVRNTLTLNVNGGTITNTGTARAIYLNSNNSIININGGALSGGEGIKISSGSGNVININDLEYITPQEGQTEKVSVLGRSDCGIRVDADNNTVNVSNGYVKGESYGICVNAYNTHINVSGGKIQGMNYDGINDDSQQGDSGNTKKIDVTGGTIIGARYGIRKWNSELTISNAEVKTTSGSKDSYAIYTRWGDTYVNDGAFINAPNASGIYAEDGVHINSGSRIYAGNSSGYGIYGRWLNGTMDGGTIEAPGSNSSAIYLKPHSTQGLKFTISDGTITSGNIGINMSEADVSGYICNIYGGTIKGGNYGVYLTNGNYTLNVGNSEDELSNTIPILIGDLYGLYNTGGTSNFFGGRLRGGVFGYKNDLNKIRSLKDIVTEYYEEDTSEYSDILTIPAATPTDEATADTAKKGDGYAKITYIGETVEGVCTNGQESTFNYTGTIVSWYAPCTGKYKLEVWGAQGGSSSNPGGYGGYSTGEINLTQNEELFVVVGGAGSGNSGHGYRYGGYNGGGDAYSNSDGNTRQASGGGATHIATKNGLLSTLSNDIDKILIVAGGGGGAAGNAWVMYTVGGSGGGYRGADGGAYREGSWVDIGSGATQTTGYAFGQGGQSVGGGAGGGFYGGYAYSYSSGGGSGYIANSRLTNKHMAGYNVPYINYKWVDNYLVNKENFLEVNGELFNSVDAASSAIPENGTGVITLIKDASLNDDSTFVGNRTITFDLNGYKLANAVNLYNDADLTIVDNSQDKTGELAGVYKDTIQNRNKLKLDGISIVNNAEAKACVYSSNANGTVTFKDTTCMAAQGHGIWAGATTTINYENSEITSYYYGIGANADNSVVNVTSGDITVNGSSAYGIYIHGHGTITTIDDVNVSSNKNGIYIYGDGSKTTINDGNIYGYTHAIYIDSNHNTSNRPNIYINDGFLSADDDHTIDIKYANVYVSGGEVKNNKNSKDCYGIVIRDWAYGEISGDAFVNSPNSSGLYSNGGYKITGGRILSGHPEGRGLYGDYLDLTMTGGTIETTGASSHGIYHSSNHAAIDISGGSIISKNNGISLFSGSSDRIVTITGGTIDADNYGIYQTNGYTTNIGSSTAELSQQIPHITGDNFAVYNTAGTVNFYNGRLTSNVDIHYGDIKNVRSGKEIIYEFEYLDNLPFTRSVRKFSGDPITNTPKVGNGYARLTYLGETSGDCINGTVHDFEYTGAEQQFNTICEGTYLIEVWGASGGGSSLDSTEGGRAGAGGYASGNIELSSEDTLYINVGGKGSYGEGSSSYGGPIGGYNGGGNGGNNISGSGGGATHIALETGLLTTFENKTDKLLIVAGGGGGTDNTGGAYGDSDDGSGGSGGGYKGGNAWVDGSPLANTGGNQTDIGPFGRGENVSTSTDTGGAGGGFHGGKVTNNNDGGGGGGSGYIDNPRLTNTKMYGYEVPSSGYIIHAYLDTPSGFLEVNGVEYNSFESAIAAIETTGTIKLLRDVFIRDQVTFPAGKTITFDLNDHEMQFTQPIINNGVLTVTDNTGKGKMTNNYDDVFVNNNNLTLNKGIFDSKYSIVYTRANSGDLTVNKDALLSATNGITINGTHNIVINGATINATQYGIELVGTNNTVNMTKGVINGNAQGIRNTASNTIIHVSEVEINAANDCIYSNGNAANIRVEESTLVATTYNGISQAASLSTAAEISVSDSTITGAQYAIHSYYNNLTVTDSILKTTANSRDRYVINSEGYDTVTLNGTTELQAPNASGMKVNGGLIINDNVIIQSDRSDGYGLNTGWADITMNGGTIITSGESSYAVNAGNNVFRFTMNGGTIDSCNIGLYLANSSSNEKTVKINDGIIRADNYGIYQTNNYNTSMGDVTAPVSKITPYIEGGITSIYKTSGSLSFNNGKLKGAVDAFQGAVDSVREGYEIYYDNEDHSVNALKIRTYSVSDVSSTPVSKMPKDGNGYARISYKPSVTESLSNVTIVGEITGEGTGSQGTNGISNTEISGKDFEYTGDEERYVVPESGIYRLETWGASGGHSLCNGNECGQPGYGSYSSGYIYLTAGQILYINVGGQGGIGILHGTATGGYNGGGTGSWDGSDDEASGGGGGATHIATKSGLLSSLESNKDKVLIVSGAGGGSSYSYRAGSGGGKTGGTGASSTLSGNQTTGYAFGQGQNGSGAADSDGVAGGGAGWYGGYMNNQSYQSCGSGGSGYIGNTRLYNKHMYGYNIQTSDDESDKTLSNGTSSCTSADPTEDCAKEGNGYARITFIQGSGDFNYTNGEQEYTVSKSGLYKIETWGAQGGNNGGYGGYSVGYTYLTTGDKLYINVGGAGTGDGTHQYRYGGYNGGGDAIGDGDGNTRQASGGGATHIAISSGLLSTFENKQDDLLIVSGGGGGHGFNVVQDRNIIGHAGGYVGVGGTDNNVVTGGSQTEGGSCGGTQSNYCQDGSFGQGGSAAYAGGGGGYYGGADYCQANSGGSGYIGNTKLFDKQMYCYNCQTSNDYATKTVSNGTDSCHSSGPVSNCAKEGNGYARISFINSSTGFDYTNDEQVYTVTSSGLYKIETWGAQGGAALDSVGGYGGYSIGYAYLTMGEKLYINVGGAGITHDNTVEFLNGGYNGGGKAIHNNNGDGYDAYRGSGGGATHIATSTGLLSTFENKQTDLLIVAGGGGGASTFRTHHSTAGSGGGINGVSAVMISGDGTAGTGGTQTAAGTPAGSFGLGGDAIQSPGWGESGGAGGGGGYYGGGRGDNNSGGSGGSGYIGNSSLLDKHMYCYNCQTSSDYATKTLSDGTDSCHSQSPSVDCAKEGNGYARITQISSAVKFDYTNGEQTYTVPSTGTYKLETWGAQGGNVPDYIGGYGGYSVGYSLLENGQKLYINVGGKGTDNLLTVGSGGYNGGGTGTGGYCVGQNRYSGSGGGATHIATQSGLLSTFEENRSKVLIASGGGGGANNMESASGSGAAAGGYLGNTATWTNHGHSYYVQPAGGSQTAGGLNGYSYTPIDREEAGFGQGGNHEGSDCSEGSGGGAGWYGGGWGHFAPGAGGSGYIGNADLFDKYMTCYNCSTSDTESTKTTSNECHSESPLAECSKEGNGSAVITVISSDEIGTYTITYSSEIGTLSFVSRSYVGTSVIGEFPVITDFGDYYFDGWYLDTDYTKRVTIDTIVEASTTLYAKWIDNATYCSRESVFDFDYNGTEQVFIPDCDGKYTLEVWGASGGGLSTTAQVANRKGAGGYSTGEINLTKGETLYINVGGQGTLGNYPAGGYNGGGAGGNSESGSGGGATHIATASGVLSSLSNNKNSVLIVAGGGGGTDDTGNGDFGGYDDGSGGSAGGYEGNAAIESGSTNNSYPGGKQDSGYAFGQGQSVSSCDSGGAGGGWYGGYVSNSCGGGGAGGSGYIANPRLMNGSMYGYKVKTKYASDKANIAYLVPLTDKISNGNVTYSNVQTAFTEAQNGDTLKLITNADISYDVVIPNKTVTFDLNGFNLSTSKTITNEGTMSIVNTNTGSGTSSIISTNSNTLLTNNNNLTINNININGYNTIDNAGTLDAQSVHINATNQGIKNTNEMNVENSIISGTNYGIYNNSVEDVTLSNNSITGGSALYNNTTGKITSYLNSIYGDITNNHSSGILNIDKGAVAGTYTNKGTSEVTNVALSNSTSTSGHVRNINNFGNMTVTNSTFTQTSTYACNGCTDNSVGIRNNSTGNLISSYNTFNITNDYGSRNRWLIGFENIGILRSSNDTVNLNNGYRTAIIYNSTSNQATVGNITSTITNGRENIAFNNQAGILNITSGNVEIKNSYDAYGVGQYAGTTTSNAINYNMHDNTYSRAFYIAGGTLNTEGGDSRIYATSNSYMVEHSSGTVNLTSGAYEIKAPTTYFTSMSQGTLNIAGGTYTSIATGTANGINMSGGTLTITGGNISMTGTTATGINASNGLITIGTLGGGVSTTNPYIEAIGSTSGTGITTGEADLYFYDGKVVATTTPRSGFLNGTEDGYDLKEFTDPNTGYKYCILDVTY